MTFEQLDLVRGYSISAIILSLVVIGYSFSLMSGTTQRVTCLVRAGAGFIGGMAGLTVFFLFTFIDGFDEYISSKGVDQVKSEYRGRFQTAAKVIRVVGEMDISALGLLFGSIGLVLLALAYFNVRKFRGAGLAKYQARS